MLYRDFLRIALLFGGALAVGVVVGHVVPALLIAAILHIVWTYRNLHRLLAWVRDFKRLEPPAVPGTFEVIALEVDYLRERHKKRKKKLANYLKQFQKATRALPDATVVLDADDAVQWANNAAAAQLGIRWPEDLGQRVTNLLRAPEVADFIRKKNPKVAAEISCPTDPARFLSILLAPFGKDQWLFVARDITQLHRANQMRSDFVANVSHELRTPITVFRGYLENLRGQSDRCPPTWEPVLEQMQHHALRMQSIVEDLLLLSRLEQEERVPDPQPVDVATMLNDIHLQARRLSGENEHLFSLEIDHTLSIAGAERELYSAFSNLVFNAVLYTPARGVIKLRWHADEQGAYFDVEDNGVGIAPEHVPRITERFYRVDSSRSRDMGGTGLGLAIVKHVLVRHEATLEVTSTLGSGSLFRCRFPRTAVLATEALVLHNAS